jgi:hypothetical protein
MAIWSIFIKESIEYSEVMSSKSLDLCRDYLSGFPLYNHHKDVFSHYDDLYYDSLIKSIYYKLDFQNEIIDNSLFNLYISEVGKRNKHKEKVINI